MPSEEIHEDIEDLSNFLEDGFDWLDEEGDDEISSNDKVVEGQLKESYDDFMLNFTNFGEHLSDAKNIHEQFIEEHNRLNEKYLKYDERILLELWKNYTTKTKASNLFGSVFNQYSLHGGMTELQYVSFLIAQRLSHTFIISSRAQLDVIQDHKLLYSHLSTWRKDETDADYIYVKEIWSKYNKSDYSALFEYIRTERYQYVRPDIFPLKLLQLEAVDPSLMILYIRDLLQIFWIIAMKIYFLNQAFVPAKNVERQGIKKALSFLQTKMWYAFNAINYYILFHFEMVDVKKFTDLPLLTHYLEGINLLLSKEISNFREPMPLERYLGLDEKEKRLMRKIFVKFNIVASLHDKTKNIAKMFNIQLNDALNSKKS